MTSVIMMNWFQNSEGKKLRVILYGFFFFEKLFYTVKQQTVSKNNPCYEIKQEIII